MERLKKAVAESIGPAEVEALREEFGERLSASERKVYALSKERDMLKREVAQLADAAKLVRERDQTIAAVMEEGEALSKKQASQEASMRKLRGLPGGRGRARGCQQAAGDGACRNHQLQETPTRWSSRPSSMPPEK